MATLKVFDTEESLVNSKVNINWVEAHWDGDLAQGTILYQDKLHTTPFGARSVLGIIQGKKMYKVSTNATGSIISAPTQVKEKYLGFQQVYSDDPETREYEISEMVKRGVEMYQFNINFSGIFLSKQEFDSNLDICWAQYDRLYNFVKSKFKYFSVRIICVCEDNNFYLNRDGQFKTNLNECLFVYANTINTNPTAFASNSDMAMDQTGQPMRVKGGEGHVTFFKDSARAIYVEFVKRTIQRYPELFAVNKCKWVSTPTTADHEMGQGYSNSWNGSGFGGGPGGWAALYDYHPLSTAYWKGTFLPNKYGNIQALRDAWGDQSISSFSTAEPPKIANITTIDQASIPQFFALAQNSQRYADWVIHVTLQYKVMLQEFKTCINTYAPGISYCLETGSMTDKLAVMRMTQHYQYYIDLFDYIKCQYGLYEWDGVTPQISGPLLRKTFPNKKFHIEINSNDVPTQSTITTSQAIKQAMKIAMRIAYKDLGVECVILICRSFNNPNIVDNGPTGFNQFPLTLQLAEEEETWLETPDSYKGGTVTSSLAQNTLDKYKKFDELHTIWLNSGAQNTEIILTDNMNTIVNPGAIVKSQFTFNQKSNGQSLPTGGAQTGNEYMLFDAFSHAINRSLILPADQGVICKFEYWIKNAAGEIVIYCKDTYGGFHPNFQPVVGAESYYRVWTPSHQDYAAFQWVRDWYNNFTAIPSTPFNVANDRGNNHFTQYSKYLVQGTHTIEFRNLGTFPVQLRAGRNESFENPDAADVYATILADGQLRSFNLNVTASLDPFEQYKINCYNR